MSEPPVPKPRDDTDAVQDIARDLADIANQIATFNGGGKRFLSDPNYNTLRNRLKNVHSAVEAPAVEARRRVRLNEGR